MGRFGRFASTSQFFLHGRKHFRQTGYRAHIHKHKEYDGFTEQPSAVAAARGREKALAGRVFMVTGSNSGIGKQIATSLAAQGARVHMVCRNLQRASLARQEIVEGTGNRDVHVLQCDCSLESSVRQCWADFIKLESGAAAAAAAGESKEGDEEAGPQAGPQAGAAPDGPRKLGALPPSVRLDGLVCNAGVLLNNKQLTAEGVEVTFACHLLFGTYLLGTLAMPSLRKAHGRLVIVSSGGMYNTRFPDFATAAGMRGDYDGQMAYAYAKRGQVLLAEQWAATEPQVKVVSAHPGWTATPAVEAAYGASKKYLEPMRTPWQGAEGIAWLLGCDSERLVSGGFYLDRRPQVKHMAGAFFTEGSFTKNSPQEVRAMMTSLQRWSSVALRPSAPQLQQFEQAKAMVPQAARSPATAMAAPIDIGRFMGRWYVVAHIPTFVDRGTANNTEDYVWDASVGKVRVKFSYSDLQLTKTSVVEQTATPINDAQTQWSLSVKVGFVPLTFPYLILDCAADFSTCLVGEPKRSFLYAMARTPSVDDATLHSMRITAMRCGYNVDQLVEVPQSWPKAPAPMVTAAAAAVTSRPAALSSPAV